MQFFFFQHCFENLKVQRSTWFPLPRRWCGSHSKPDRAGHSQGCTPWRQRLLKRGRPVNTRGKDGPDFVCERAERQRERSLGGDPRGNAAGKGYNSQAQGGVGWKGSTEARDLSDFALVTWREHHTAWETWTASHTGCSYPMKRELKHLD